MIARAACGGLLSVLLTGFMLVAEAAEDPPRRVVSMNLCTDQLALLVAASGQLLSVSQFAADPQMSPLADQAAGLDVNHGQAEEIALLRPDLVLAGRYTTAVTVEMLQRLGQRVVIFEPENSIDDIRTNLRRMGTALHREDQAEALIAAMDADLADHLAELPPDRPTALIYQTGGHVTGADSLGDAILSAAGLRNRAADLGLARGGVGGLEDLLLQAPDIILRSAGAGGQARDQERLDHPALTALIAQDRQILSLGPEWVCGTPATVTAIDRLARAARPRNPAP